jgi:hypothetical protein
MSLGQMEKQLSDMFKEAGPEPTFSMAQIVEQLNQICELDGQTTQRPDQPV